MSRFPQKLSKKIFLNKKTRFIGSPEKIFARFYKYNYWGNKESRSGFGSSLSSTENIRRKLPNLFKDYDIKKVLDAPCGDFNWMRHVVPISGIQYIGGDIVESLVCLNQRKYGEKGGGVSFIHIDITKDYLPDADLMIVRDCLIHFSYKDIYRFIKNFCGSDILYLLTTNHIASSIQDMKNRDIKTGDFRNIYLFEPPFSFPANPLLRIEDWQYPDPPHEVCLFSKQQALDSLEALNRNLSWPELY